MADHDDAGFYEIQLNNKQLVFFFMAAVAIAVVVFLCGVMVGRGVQDSRMAAAGANTVNEPEARRTADNGESTTPAEVRRELDYQKRLERVAVDDRLEDASSSPEKLVQAAVKEPTSKPDSTPETTTVKSPPTGGAAKNPPPRTSTAAERPAAVRPNTAKLLGSEEGSFAIQVIALKTRESAQSLVSRLKNKGYRSYFEAAGTAGLFRVRVGLFKSRSEAEPVVRMLRENEKFEPYITQ